MTLSEFVEVTSEMERFYAKELTTDQRNIWFEELKRVSKERYRQISRQVYNTCKFMPKLADIVEINKNLPVLVNTENSKRCTCNKCNSTGIVIYKRILEKIEYTYGARCNCQNGLRISKTVPSVEEIGIM